MASDTDTDPAGPAHAAFPHPSRPGFYAVTFTDALRTALSNVVDALIPGDDTLPSASQAQVVRFIEERASPADRDRLQALLPPDRGDGTVQAALEDLQARHSEEFGWLRDLTYHGYYASRRVLAALSEAGHEYHGAPQPLGYAVTEPMLMPTAARGRFIPTAEVTRVQD